MSSESDSTFRERTLATRYQPRQELPPNFAAILKEYAREVLRAQPADLLEWSAAYFKKLALEHDPLQAQQPPPDHYRPSIEDADHEILSQKLIKIFAAIDTTGEGVLYTRLVRRALMESCGLSEAQALYILSCDYAKVEKDDTIVYAPFAHEAAREVRFFAQSGQDFIVPTADSNVADNGELEELTVHGLNAQDTAYQFLRLFRLIDESGTGRVSFEDYRNALMNAPFHLTRRDIRVLCLQCHRTDGGDEVEYEKEVPSIFSHLLLAQQFELFDTEDEEGEENGQAEARQQEQQMAEEEREERDEDAEQADNEVEDVVVEEEEATPSSEAFVE